jgi:nicotinamidase-related amidase
MNQQQISLAAQSQPFLDYLEKWMDNLRPARLSDIQSDSARIALVVVDITNGFCNQGALASPRVKSIVQPSTKLMQAAWDYGVRNFLLSFDSHEPDAAEFQSWPPHCMRGDNESEPVDEIKNLSFFDHIHFIPKNSISSSQNTSLLDWVTRKPEINTFIVIGDCTDLCTYQLAMDLKLDANARQLEHNILVPADCVQTYDMPIAAAAELGAMPHPGDLTHAFFLYHMALNGVSITHSLTL